MIQLPNQGILTLPTRNPGRDMLIQRIKSPQLPFIKIATEKEVPTPTFPFGAKITMSEIRAS